MLQPQLQSPALHPGRLGNLAVQELTLMIAAAVRSCDDELVTQLDRILRDVEMLIEQKSTWSSAQTWP